MPRVLFLFGFLVNLAVIVGGLTDVAWLGRSLVLYALLDGPVVGGGDRNRNEPLCFRQVLCLGRPQEAGGQQAKPAPFPPPSTPVQMRLEPFPGKRKFLGEGLENLIKLPHRG